MADGKAKRPPVDWDAMEPDWRAGLKSVLQLSKEYGVSRPAIDKHWAKEGVERDLSAKIRSKSDALVAQAVVAPLVAQNRRVSERQIVEANANVSASAVLAQHADLAESADLERKLMVELMVMTDQNESFEKFGEMMRQPDEINQDKKNDLYNGAISHPQRVKSAKLLMDMRKARIETERKVLRIDEKVQPGDTATTLTDAQRASRIATLLAKAGS